MSADTLNIGQLITTEQFRDAIHIAVVPVTAAQTLLPGQHVSLVNPENLEVGYCQHTLGVVDPFLKQPVEKGQRFWLFLYPGSITSLRHEWTHPKFPATQHQVPVTEHQIGLKSAKEESEKWLREYAQRLNPYSLGPDYGSTVTEEGKDRAFKELIADLERGEIYARGSDLHGLYELEDSDELAKHALIYLGKVIDWNRYEFTCSC